VTLYLRQVWKDDRLAFYSRGNRSVTLNHRQFDRMWTPDVFVRNLKAGVFHTITVPNRLIRLSPDGTILYSQRLTLTLACDMIFSNYPMDNQTCKIELGSCKFDLVEQNLVLKPCIEFSMHIANCVKIYEPIAKLISLSSNSDWPVLIY